MEPLVEPQFARVPPFRPEPDEASVRAALKILQDVGAAGDRRRRRRARLGRGRRARRARRGAANSGRDLAQRQGFDSRQSSALGRRRRHLFARERQPRRQCRRSRLLHRQRDRRHDHAFLGGAEDRHAGDPDRHRSGSARPQLSARGGRQRRRQGDARAHARRSPTAPAPAKRKSLDRRRRKAICGEWRQKYKAALESDAVPIRPERLCQRADAARAGRRHRRRRHRPCRHVDGRHVRSEDRRARATCAAPAISAGRFRPGSAPNAAARSGRWSPSPATPVFGITSPRSRPRCAGTSTR